MKDSERTFASANVSVVTDRILIGGDISHVPELAARQVVELRKFGVTHVAECRIEWSDADIWEQVPDVNYLHHGMDDAGQAVPDSWFSAGVRFLQAGLHQTDGIVLAHCHMGINRGPSLGLALLLTESWEIVEAMDAIRAARPIAHVWYAEQALAWHHRQTDATRSDRQRDRARLAAWRSRDTLDVAAVIRAIRSSGGTAA